MPTTAMIPPRVSIGLPVYNGEEYLRDAIESHCRQTFTDFELIVCDNASTDGTERIVRDCMAHDPRIRYHRHAGNIGAGRNFNYVVTLARGTYFKWAAHDDICHPELLAKCVAELDAHPEAVVAYPRAQHIDRTGQPGAVYIDPLATDDPSPVVRFDALQRGHPCYQVFGLIRLSALRTTPLIGLYAHGDGVLLCQLALRGRFIKIPEPLFFPRHHDKQSMTMIGDYQAYARWFDPRLKTAAVFPWWRIYGELLRTIGASPLPLKTRIACYFYWAKWAFARRDRFLRDVAYNLRHFLGAMRAGWKSKPAV